MRLIIQQKSYYKAKFHKSFPNHNENLSVFPPSSTAFDIINFLSDTKTHTLASIHYATAQLNRQETPRLLEWNQAQEIIYQHRWEKKLELQRLLPPILSALLLGIPFPFPCFLFPRKFSGQEAKEVENELKPVYYDFVLTKSRVFKANVA